MQPRVTTAQKEGDRKCHELLMNDGAEKVTKKKEMLRKHSGSISIHNEKVLFIVSM